VIAAAPGAAAAPTSPRAPPAAASPRTGGRLLELCGLAVAASPAAPSVLSGVDLTVDPGERVALVGVSGAGKTTLLRTLAGQVAPRAGVVRVDGQDLAALSGAARRRARATIGLITQKHDLVDTLRVDKNVMAGALGRWSDLRAVRFLFWSNREELAQASAALAAVGLADNLRAPTHALSGGEQQRVAIARALVQAPRVLLADEPVASLDPATAVEVLDLLTRLTRERGMALICSLHQPALAARFFDRILEANDGALVERPNGPVLPGAA
jgi:phosphonate transport system ATP-binding protein